MHGRRRSAASEQRQKRATRTRNEEEGEKRQGCGTDSNRILLAGRSKDSGHPRLTCKCSCGRDSRLGRFQTHNGRGSVVGSAERPEGHDHKQRRGRGVRPVVSTSVSEHTDGMREERKGCKTRSELVRETLRDGAGGWMESKALRDAKGDTRVYVRSSLPGR